MSSLIGHSARGSFRRPLKTMAIFANAPVSDGMSSPRAERRECERLLQLVWSVSALKDMPVAEYADRELARRAPSADGVPEVVAFLRAHDKAGEAIACALPELDAAAVRAVMAVAERTLDRML